MTTKTRPTTAEELLRLPDDGFRYELIRGELVKTTPPGQYHGKLAMNVGVDLKIHVRRAGIGEVYTETGYTLSSNPDTVRAPDISFVSRERLDEIGETEGYWQGAPDLAVEVVSPSDRCTRAADKVAEWLRAGTRMVIVVNPRNRTVEVHRSPTDAVTLAEGDVLDGADVIPGWTMPVASIFS